LMESPPHGGGTSSSRDGGDPDDPYPSSSSARQSTGKKQKLYNALHYSALYDEDQRCMQHGQPQCPYCGRDPSASPIHGGGGSPAHVVPGSNTPTPLKVHERFFQQRPAPALNYSPAKSQLNPLRSGPGGQSLDVRTLPPSSGRGERDLGPGAPFGMARKAAA
jgi:hypothetical protein